MVALSVRARAIPRRNPSFSSKRSDCFFCSSFPKDDRLGTTFRKAKRCNLQRFCIVLIDRCKKCLACSTPVFCAQRLERRRTTLSPFAPPSSAGETDLKNCARPGRGGERNTTTRSLQFAHMTAHNPSVRTQPHNFRRPRRVLRFKRKGTRAKHFFCKNILT